MVTLSMSLWLALLPAVEPEPLGRAAVESPSPQGKGGAEKTTSRPTAPGTVAPAPPGAAPAVDPNGWPRAAGARPGAGTSVPPEPVVRPAGPPASVWLTGGSSEQGALDPQSLASPLRDIWQIVGRPESFSGQGGARAQLKLHVFDSSGRKVGTRVVYHEADLRFPERDRLEFAEGRKVFGRDGRAAWAMIDNVLWHSHEQQAREMLDILGLLIRVPWVFSDPRFRTFREEPVTVGGENLVQVRIEARASGESERIGPDENEVPTDRFALLCDRQMRPRELRYRLVGGAQECRVQLLDYRGLPRGVVVPVRRVFLDHQGRRLMEIEVVRMDTALEIPVEQFRPPARVGYVPPR